MTPEFIIRKNMEANRLGLEEERKAMRKWIGKLRETLDAVEEAMDKPLPDLGLYDIYLGPVWSLESDCERVVRCSNNFEELKRADKVICAIASGLKEAKL